jgi:hypothetical protein
MRRGVQIFRRYCDEVSSGCGDGDEFVAGAEKERAGRNRGRGEAGFAEGIARSDGERGGDWNDENVAQLTREIKVAAVGDR